VESGFAQGEASAQKMSILVTTKPSDHRFQPRRATSGVWVLVALSVILLAAGCGRSDGTMARALTHMPQPTHRLGPTPTLDPGSTGPTPVCPLARGEGTVSPAVSIYSIGFVVNGAEQPVGDDNTLHALPGDEVRVREVTICTGSFSGNGGEACVDLVPVGQSGQEIESERRGTHTVRLTAGFISIPGPSDSWAIAEDWRHIAVVLNHWPAEDTQDLGCGSGRCERDDRIMVGLR